MRAAERLHGGVSLSPDACVYTRLGLHKTVSLSVGLFIVDARALSFIQKHTGLLLGFLFFSCISWQIFKRANCRIRFRTDRWHEPCINIGTSARFTFGETRSF